MQTMTIDQLIQASIEKANGSRIGYATYEYAHFQVYTITVEQRTRSMATHYRHTFYINVNGQWKRTNRKAFEQALATHNQSSH
jgi:hypothetical protein